MALSAPLKYLSAFFILSVLASCASVIKPYVSGLPTNFEIVNRTESVEASLHIYNLDEQCVADYQGTIALNDSRSEVGVTPGQPTLLEVGFSSSSFWGSSSGYISYPVTLVPGSALRYRIEASYRDDIYNVAVFEINRSTGKKRQMTDEELQICR